MSASASEAVDSAVDDEMLLRRRRLHRDTGEVMGLNLTAMMDVLTILLVYLIKVYAEAPDNVPLNDDLRVPTSSAPANMVPSVSVMITKSAILVDQKAVLVVKVGQIVTEDPSKKYLPLARALEKRKEIIDAIHDGGGPPFDGNLMIIADEDTPYDLISSVLYQAGRAEYTNYRLIVRKL